MFKGGKIRENFWLPAAVYHFPPPALKRGAADAYLRQKFKHERIS